MVSSSSTACSLCFENSRFFVSLCLYPHPGAPDIRISMILADIFLVPLLYIKYKSFVWLSF